ncbi:EAL domain-containing protein [Arthrobacter agilis]|uniref:EAL domain-containing protein n=1 Tax=Arthrobacter agilis TaxID=37921 RepID=UPI0023671BDE|nr:EAL domain-containing protein [Arthrobacter agilis]WDF33580.1 EAL domain-containing protein [Arthrobacter agilis]
MSTGARVRARRVAGKPFIDLVHPPSRAAVQAFRRESFAIVTAVISLTHPLGMKVLAEGVETPTQVLILHGLGCDQGQGYLHGGPRALTIA